jgi:hypothetical protein
MATEQNHTSQSERKPLDIEALNALATKLRVHADAIRNPAAQKKLGIDLHTAADTASQMAHWRFIVAEVAASLPAGNFARNEILKLLGPDMLASAEPTFYTIFFDMPDPYQVAANVRMAQTDIPSLEEATEIIAGTLEGGTDCYRRHNAVIAECRGSYERVGNEPMGAQRWRGGGAAVARRTDTKRKRAVPRRWGGLLILILGLIPMVRRGQRELPHFLHCLCCRRVALGHGAGRGSAGRLLCDLQGSFMGLRRIADGRHRGRVGLCGSVDGSEYRPVRDWTAPDRQSLSSVAATSRMGVVCNSGRCRLGCRYSHVYRARCP